MPLPHYGQEKVILEKLDPIYNSTFEIVPFTKVNYLSLAEKEKETNKSDTDYSIIRNLSFFEITESVINYTKSLNSIKMLLNLHQGSLQETLKMCKLTDIIVINLFDKSGEVHDRITSFVEFENYSISGDCTSPSIMSLEVFFEITYENIESIVRYKTKQKI